jgi:site-specific DNA-methyltransferase (adenine-specific)
MKELSSIRKHPNNPRTYGDKEIRKIAKSITEFPQMMEARPIIVNAEGEILGGHIRYEALLSLGYTEVDDAWIDTFTTEQAERFIITDNVSYGEWDVAASAATYTKEELKGWGG